MRPSDPPSIAMPLTGAAWPAGLRRPLGGTRPWGDRRIGPRLLASALLHLALAALIVLWAVRRPFEEAAISPASFQLVLQPSESRGMPGDAVPSEPPPPSAPPAPATPPVATPTPAELQRTPVRTPQPPPAPAAALPRPASTVPPPPAAPSSPPPAAALPARGPGPSAPPLPSPLAGAPEPLPNPSMTVPPAAALPAPAPALPPAASPSTAAPQSAPTPLAPQPPSSRAAEDVARVPAPPVPMPPAAAASAPQPAQTPSAQPPPSQREAAPRSLPGQPPAQSAALLPQSVPMPAAPMPAPPMPPAVLPGAVPTPTVQLPQLPSRGLPQPIPLPAVPAPAPPRAEEPPSVRLSLSPLLPDALTPEPVPTPEPTPQLPPQPAPRPRPAPARRPSLAFPAPMDLSFNGGDAPPRRRGNGGLDTTLDTATLNARGPVPRDFEAPEGVIHVRGAHVGKEWIDQLHEWWVQHSYYPDEAVRQGQDGTVKIHVHVDRYGRVHLVELESTSGSQWLDAGAQAVFRGAALPPFPAATPEPDADLDLTIDYVLVRR